jgi:hypothetical protein
VDKTIKVGLLKFSTFMHRVVLQLEKAFAPRPFFGFFDFQIHAKLELNFEVQP